MKTSYVVQNYNVLLDTTNVVLTVGTDVSAMVFLVECTPDTHYALSVNKPNYVDSFLWLFFFESVKPEDYPKWTWDNLTRKFVKTKAGVLNDELRAKSRLAEHKRAVIERIMTNLSITRFRSRTGVYGQEWVYADKKAEAQAFRASGYDENILVECPYVAQYADYAKISLRQAADDILFNVKLDKHNIANTELLRLRYFNLVKKATSSEELNTIVDGFMSDCYHK
ncbi:MAG: hypothetical protein WD897_00320 [Parcubacteria group bacterium]